ncbi:hypothetical protein B0H16DRAFT_1311834 [Mycena metata]|uniref:F-box domain-containing protein n=1 Tax=Mycena metata TaxID=1033252 RepID=A0AAD7NHP2_9AGAR|nr:hypothetical protein B0H16DRAFT_1311834 [Mycena metata]
MVFPPTTNENFREPLRLTSHELRTRALTLDTEILALCTQLDARLTDRATVQEALDTIVYPVLTLPVEITSEIFCWTVLHPGRVPPTWIPLHQHFVLGQICRVWCQIVLSTPKLWNTITLRALDGVEGQNLFRLQTFLSRAAPLPLSISFYNHIAWETDVFSIFASHCRTWGNLSFSGPFGNLEPLTTINQLPMLKSLKLILDDTADENMFGVMLLGDLGIHSVF